MTRELPEIEVVDGDTLDGHVARLSADGYELVCVPASDLGHESGASALHTAAEATLRGVLGLYGDAPVRILRTDRQVGLFVQKEAKAA